MALQVVDGSPEKFGIVKEEPEPSVTVGAEDIPRLAGLMRMIGVPSLHLLAADTTTPSLCKPGGIVAFL